MDYAIVGIPIIIMLVTITRQGCTQGGFDGVRTNPPLMGGSRGGGPWTPPRSFNFQAPVFMLWHFYEEVDLLGPILNNYC